MQHFHFTGELEMNADVTELFLGSRRASTYKCSNHLLAQAPVNTKKAQTAEVGFVFNRAL